MAEFTHEEQVEIVRKAFSLETAIMVEGANVDLVKRFAIGDVPCKAFISRSDAVELAVLAIHGFSGSKDGSTIDALANSLCPCGAAVHCFDFPAHGEHPAGGEALSLKNCADALLSVARYMNDAHPHARKGVFATSFGGYMTLLCLEELEGILGGFDLVLKAPAVKMAETFEHVIVGDKMELLEQQGFIDLGFQRKMDVRKEYFDELRAHDVCRDYGRPMLVIHGDSDEVVLPADIDELVATNPLAKLVRIPGAGHDFKGEGQLEAIVEAARTWFFEPSDQSGC